MEYVYKAGYPISKMTLGTVQLGMSYGINNKSGMPSYEESKRILDTALDGGIRCFDTARAYGVSEEVLGRFFGERETEKTIVTKLLFGSESPDEIADTVFYQVKDSMKRLGVSKIPFLMLHRDEYVERYGNRLTSALRELKEEGLVGSLGISFSDKSKLHILEESDLFDCIQIPASIFDNKELRDGKIAALGACGVAVFIRSVYLQGLFFKDTSTLPPALMTAKPALDKLHAISEAAEISISELAISYIKDEPGIASLVIGAECPEQVKDSIEKINSKPLAHAVREELTALSEEVDPIVLRPWEWNK